MRHKKLMNNLSLRLDQLEEENLRLSEKLKKQDYMIMNFFYNCKNTLKHSKLLDKIQHVS